MSFVYAFKSENSIYMIGDTKVTIDDTKGGKPFEGMRRLIEEYGILKTIILHDEIALGFASDNLKHVNCALKSILNNTLPLEDIINILVKSSRENDDASEYILAYKNQNIYLIKNGIVEERENCYVGSHDIFEELQKRRNNRPISPNIVLPIIRSLIKDEIIDNRVGGFCTELEYNVIKQKYQYTETFDSLVTKERYIPSGATLPIVDNAEDGGFTYITSPFEIEGTNQFLAIQILQNKKTYTYIPQPDTLPCNCDFNYLFLPFDISGRV